MSIGIIGGADGPTSILVTTSAPARHYHDAEAPPELREALERLLPQICERLGRPELKEKAHSRYFVVCEQLNIVILTWEEEIPGAEKISLTLCLPDGAIQQFFLQIQGSRWKPFRLPRNPRDLAAAKAQETIARLCPDLNIRLVEKEYQYVCQSGTADGEHFFVFETLLHGLPLLNEKINISLDRELHCVSFFRTGPLHRIAAPPDQPHTSEEVRQAFLEQFTPELVYLLPISSAESALPVYRAKANSLVLLHGESLKLETLRDPEHSVPTPDLRLELNLDHLHPRYHSPHDDLAMGSPILSLPEAHRQKHLADMPELFLPATPELTAQKYEISSQGKLLVHLFAEGATITLDSENTELLYFASLTDEETSFPESEAALPEDELQLLAEQFLQKYKPNYLKDLRLENTPEAVSLNYQMRFAPQTFQQLFAKANLESTQNPEQGLPKLVLRTFTWQRTVNGIPVMGDGLRLVLEIFSGRVVFFEQAWRFDATFPAVETLLQPREAVSRLLEAQEPTLLYFSNRMTRRAELYWGHPQHHLSAINAQNGDLLAWEGMPLTPAQEPRFSLLPLGPMHQLAELLTVTGFIAPEGEPLLPDQPVTQQEYLRLMQALRVPSQPDVYRFALDTTLVTPLEIRPDALVTCAEALILFARALHAYNARFSRGSASRDGTTDDTAAREQELRGALVLARHFKLIDEQRWDPHADLTWGEALRLLQAYLEVRHEPRD